MYRNANRPNSGRYSRGGFRNKRNGSRGFRDEKIQHAQYIAKATEIVESTPYDTSVTYNDFDLEPILKANIKKKGYVHPTKVQAQAIPVVIAGRDLLAMASTGSGKTAAFLIPLINKVLRDKTQKCLIITPTRELALQIKNEFDTFASGAGLGRTLVIGGENMRQQITSLKYKPHFVIGTPGRILDLYTRKVLDLDMFSNIVLDEVDRMLDMGFVKDITTIVAKVAPVRQSLFFSATISPVSENIARSLLIAPERISMERQAPHKNVEQNIVKYTSREHKMQLLHDLLNSQEVEKVLVFSRTKRDADVLSRDLRVRGFKAEAIHGNKSQNTRTRTLSMFRDNRIQILVATDVASRGIDVPDITHVINYDEPATYADYIHRIGRTGRIGKKGVALTFVR